MARKKAEGGEPPTVAVKIDRALASKAKMIATDRGIDLADYLSDALRAVVDRDWAQMVRRASGEAGAGRPARPARPRGKRPAGE